ncbi:hypothetical protein ISCGN_003071 [Ixodes scapularis]
MDGEGRTVMITVDGSTLPKEVLYRLHLKKVFPFQHGSELKRRLAASAHLPDIILLQEARVPEPKFVGYRAFSTPTIIVAQKGPPKDWGADTHTLRMLVRSLIQAKMLYGAQHVGITRKQREDLEVLNRRAMRIVTGLPNFTPVDTLQAHAGLNTIGDLLHEACLGQHIRLSRSRPGRSILGLLGLRPVEGVPPPATPPPPWSLPCLTSGKPTPSHAGGGHPGRRRSQAAAHERDVNADGPEVRRYYCDAAADPESGSTAAAACCLSLGSTTGVRLPPGLDSLEAELRAILLGAELALRDTATRGLSPTEILLHTDPAEAVKACLSSAPPRSPTVCSIRAAVAAGTRVGPGIGRTHQGRLGSGPRGHRGQ